MTIPTALGATAFAGHGRTLPVFDVHTSAEYAYGRLPGAVSIPPVLER